MRIRHHQMFPMPWVHSDSFTDPVGDFTFWPRTFTRKQAVRLWWRPKKLQFDATIAMTDTNGSPSEGSNTLTVSAELIRKRYTSAHALSGVAASSEKDLLYPGNDGTVTTSYFSGCYLYAAESGSVSATASGRTFDEANATIEVETFGSTTHCIEYNDGTFRPFFSVQMTIPALPGGRIYIDSNGFGSPSTLLEFDGNISGLGVGFAGLTLRCRAYADEDSSGWPYEEPTSASMTVATSEFFPYSQIGGGDPVWNAATGAQILDPRAASVP